VSRAEGRIVDLSDITPSETALAIQKRIPRKDARTIQVMINETGQPDGGRIELGDNYIAGWLPNGIRLTSAGVDKLSEESVILLPSDPDRSAREIGKTLLGATGLRIGVIVTDSDGRIEKRGSTQLSIGVYGVPAERISHSQTPDGETKTAEEPICDMLASSAGLIMGQRGTNKPVVLIRGFEYGFDENAVVTDSLTRTRHVLSRFYSTE
jgi:F420-0:gamma-glutamyl ligase